MPVGGAAAAPAAAAAAPAAAEEKKGLLILIAKCFLCFVNLRDDFYHNHHLSAEKDDVNL